MKMSEAEFERQYVAATKRGEEELRTQPWAVSVKYDRRYSRLVVKLNKGTILTVPTSLVPELKGLKPDDLAKVSVLPPGFDLDWEHLDIQVSIAWLLTGMYGRQNEKSLISEERRLATAKSRSKVVRGGGVKSGRSRLKRTRLSATKRVVSYFV